jgi:putative ABC transport system ATP-binding protein
MSGITAAARRQQDARRALEAVGPGDRLQHLPQELPAGSSSRSPLPGAGQQPAFILADEPTAIWTASPAKILGLLPAAVRPDHRHGLTRP